MENLSKFINELQSIDVITEKCYLIEGIGYVKEKDFPINGKNNFKSLVVYSLNKVDEVELKKLHTNAKTSLILLSNEQLERTKATLQTFNRKNFYSVLQPFYVMFSKGEAHPMHEMDFKRSMSGTFICDIPTRGTITIEFLHDLIDEVGNKSGHTHSIIQHIDKLLGEKVKKEAPKPFDIPESVLKGLEEKKFIENAKVTPINWLKNKQLLRELLTNDKIKKEWAKPVDIENATPLYFMYKGKPAILAKNKETPTWDSKTIKDFCDLISD